MSCNVLNLLFTFWERKKWIKVWLINEKRFSNFVTWKTIHSFWFNHNFLQLVLIFLNVSQQIEVLSSNKKGNNLFWNSRWTRNERILQSIAAKAVLQNKDMIILNQRDMRKTPPALIWKWGWENGLSLKQRSWATESELTVVSELTLCSTASFTSHGKRDWTLLLWIMKCLSIMF